MSGTVNSQLFWKLPQLPNLLSEWAAIIPLVCHLASFQTDYQTTGRVSLLGRLTVSMFPRLGDLASLSRLCKDGPEFLDEASVRGSSSQTVRDVQWGSVFPCANGASSALIAAYALSRRRDRLIRMPETPDKEENDKDTKPPIATTRHTGLTTAPVGHRRYQTLHVLNFDRRPVQSSWEMRFEHLLSSFTFHWVGVLVLCACIVVLGLCGLFGTAVAVLLGTISQVAARFVPVRRPLGYLENNEAHSACMLVSTHRNANIWYLYIGDRGVVDSVLNKTMINIPETRRGTAIAYLLKFIHTVQLLTMTYVAAQKGWDGVGLVLLMVATWTLQLRYTNDALVKHWLDSENISVEATSFEFTGRTIMLGAIQAFSGSQRTLWMDEIVAPHPRRDAWLEKLGVEYSQINPPFNDVDLKAISITSGLAKAALRVMRGELKPKQHQSG